MRDHLEVWVTESIRKGRGGLVTRPLSWLFALVVRCRHALYDRGLLEKKYAPLPVVSIGNLVVGGSGKTQVALLLAQELSNVAILSRGYRGGDEANLLASRLPEVKVIAQRDRYASAVEAERLGAKVVLLDDGMQHRRLFRDFEIVVLSGADPFGGGHFLPRGFLREDPQRLKYADLVVFVGKPSELVEKKVAALTEAPCMETKICVKELSLLSGEPITMIRGKKVGIFCGIGNPSRFAASLETEGAILIASRYLPDHRKIGEKELEAFAALCKERGAEYLLCTEKDKVKLDPAVKSPLPIGWVKVELEIVKNRESWERIKREIIR